MKKYLEKHMKKALIFLLVIIGAFGISVKNAQICKSESKSVQETTDNVLSDFFNAKELRHDFTEYREITIRVEKPSQETVALALYNYIAEQLGNTDFNAALSEFVEKNYNPDTESEYTFMADETGGIWSKEAFMKAVDYNPEAYEGSYEAYICRNGNPEDYGWSIITFKVQEISSNKWVKKDGIWYCYDKNGKMYTNSWIKTGNYNWSYVDEAGRAYQYTWATIDGSLYRFDERAYMRANTWLRSGNNWRYMGKDGKAYENTWAKIFGEWYYFGIDTIMYKNCWIPYGSKWCYVNGSGKAYRSTWAKIDGKFYCFDRDGYMLKDIYIGKYYVDKNGVWIPSKDKK